MVKEILLSLVFIVMYFGSIILYMTRVYVVLEPRVRAWLGQRLGLKITNPPGSRGTKWAIEGKYTTRHSLIVFLVQLGFVTSVIIIPMMGLLAVLVGLLALLNSGL
jgi:hypothetical protein